MRFYSNPLLFNCVVALAATTFLSTSFASPTTYTAYNGQKISALVRAYTQQDFLAVRRAAALIGVAGLRELLTHKSRVYQRAAIAGAPHCRQSWQLLEPLGRLMSEPDRDVAVMAGNAMRQLTASLRPDLLERYEESEQTMYPVVQQIIDSALNRQISIDVRQLAILNLAQLKSLISRWPQRADRFIHDPDPAIRQVAIEFVIARPTPENKAQVCRVLASDPSAAVKKAALVALCAIHDDTCLRSEISPAQFKAVAGGTTDRRSSDGDDNSRDVVIELKRCHLRLQQPNTK